MKFKTIIKFSSIHLAILTFLLFLSFNGIENGDMNTVIFGALIYFPYLICLTFLNTTLIALGLNYFNTNLPKWISAAFTSMVLTTWYLISGGQLKIHFWKVKQNEFITLNFILLFLNLATIYFVTKQQKEKEKKN